jgi:filamentous hemagglutinin family protein
MLREFTILFLNTVFLTLIGFNECKAQVLPDKTLTNVSKVSQQNNIFNITGGTRSGNNLFHSFLDLSIPLGHVGYFNNSLDLSNIIVRVTGSSISNIDGTLRSNGQSNLFFINPNGIIFGSNAKLDIGGSFLATTANSIEFSDGLLFRTSNSHFDPNLSSAIPVGLNFGNNSGSIHVLGPGHIFTLSNPVISPVNKGSQIENGLKVLNGKSISLIGSEVELQGGLLNAPSGHIEIGGVSNGKVSFEILNVGWLFNYSLVNSFGDVRLLKASDVDASGKGNSSINLQGRNLEVSDGSIVLIQNQGVEDAGDISANFVDSIVLKGKSSNGFPTRIVNEALNLGASGEISLQSRTLRVSDGAAITTRTYSVAKSKGINIKADDSIVLDGYDLIDPTLYSFILSGTTSSGSAGNVSINTNELKVLDGSAISSATIGDGNGGNVLINSKSVEVNGASPAEIKSAIFASTAKKGNGGNLTINARSINVLNGGSIASVTAAEGNAGNIIINASDFINIDGYLQNDPSIKSQISASASPQTSSTRKLFNLPSLPSGKPGGIKIRTPRLSVQNQGQIVTINQGTNNSKGGELNINSDFILIDNKGSFQATSKFGAGGDITLTSQDIRLMNGGFINASTSIDPQNNDVGGNITINTKLLTLLNNSSITANSANSFGGNIIIKAEALFTSPSSRITASGIGNSFDGKVVVSTNKNVVLLNTLKIKEDTLAPLPITCDSKSGKAFYVLTEEYMTKDIMDLISADPEFPHIIDSDGIRKPLILAVGWVPDRTGKLKALRAIPVSILTPNASEKICETAFRANKN